MFDLYERAAAQYSPLASVKIKHIYYMFDMNHLNVKHIICLIYMFETKWFISNK